MGLSVQEKFKTDFQESKLWRPSCISDWNVFCYFLSTSHSDAFYEVSSQLAIRFRRRSAKDSGHRGHLGFQIRMILAYFLSTSHPDASYQVSSQLVFPFNRRREK